MAKKKPKTTEELVKEQADAIRKWLECWLKMLQTGCNDPFWADGANMNLVRNHIVYAKQKIKELTAEDETLRPEEFYWEIPPYIDENFFAVPASDRAVRIMSGPGWKCCNHETPASAKKLKRFSERVRQNQLCLF